MKRTYTANISGQVFHIDEDAYDLLQDYFNQLRATFGGEEGGEIVSDIEIRVREHFEETMAKGARVITKEDVSNVIATMGRPEELGQAAEGGGNENDGPCPPPFVEAEGNQPRKLYRDMQNKVLGGVIGGLGVYLGWNASIMRLLVIILALCTRLWPLVLVYLIAWMVIPAAVTPAQLLRMHGKPVTVGSMSRAVADGLAATAGDTGFLRTLFQIFGKVAIGILGIIGCVVATAGIIALLFEVTGMIMWAGYGNEAFMSHMGIFEEAAPVLFGVQALLWTLFAILLGGAAAWLAACVLLGVRGASRATFITGTVMAAILFAASMVVTGICSAII